MSSFRRITPPPNHKPLKPDSLYKALVLGDVEMYERCEARILAIYNKINYLEIV